jgi:hypothetical protein
MMEKGMTLSQAKLVDVVPNDSQKCIAMTEGIYQSLQNILPDAGK